MKANLKFVSSSMFLLALVAGSAQASSFYLSTGATTVGGVGLSVANPDDLKQSGESTGQGAVESSQNTPAVMGQSSKGSADTSIGSSKGSSDGSSGKSSDRYRVFGNDVALKQAVELVGSAGQLEKYEISPVLSSALESERNTLKESLPVEQVAAMSDVDVARSMIQRRTSASAQ